ncbi:DUF6507 family protein [Streptomyces gilvosporeus]|uniref:DUF6507 family protein n=2 Tax=Streptomyces gilvosporeus TaxID=553510 RepID=UPI0033F9421B
MGAVGMTGWDLTPSGVNHVLDKTSRTAGELGEQISAYGGPKGDLLKAAHAVGTLQMAGEKPPSGPPGPDGKSAPSGLLASALAEFAAKTQDDLTFLLARTKKSVDGAANAAREYLEGDERMASHTLQQALKAPDLHPHKHTGTHGHGHGGK